MIHRNTSFEEISEKIIKKDYLDIIENPNRDNQQFFVMILNEYTWIIPFIIDDMDNIVLKTAYPSRKSNKKYGEKK